MDYMKIYEEWTTNPFFSEETRQELLESISLFYRVFYLHETFEEADGESKEQ